MKSESYALCKIVSKTKCIVHGLDNDNDNENSLL